MEPWVAGDWELVSDGLSVLGNGLCTTPLGMPKGNGHPAEGRSRWVGKDVGKDQFVADPKHTLQGIDTYPTLGKRKSS